MQNRRAPVESYEHPKTDQLCLLGHEEVRIESVTASNPRRLQRLVNCRQIAQTDSLGGVGGALLTKKTNGDTAVETMPRTRI
jgi:hypothetical protein